MEYLRFATLLMDDAATSSEPAAATGNPGLVMVLFKVVIAVYLLAGAIRGKGKLIDNQFPKCKPETYRLLMRLICAFAALVILANSAFEYLSGTTYLALTLEEYGVINTVLWAVGLVALLALIVVNAVLTDRKAMEEARKRQDQERRGASKGDPLRAAFVFDEEEEAQGEFTRKTGADEGAADAGNPNDQA
ncbi:MAG: hypothetical protein BWY35_00711 [Firmicutes bacterium ADurb.Bin248]|nr:MAG: hypothetical protein BWY35_00711 [Firmicutes bacterium ADurb.Bin248]HOG00914.1 hypothetical protein [Clostridia bacterium]HPK14785.1 hypothetical protein [Clostridia bacterium]